MITFKQITKASAIASLSDYYVLDVRTTGPNPAVNAISSVSMLQVEEDLVIQEAVVRIASESDAGAASESGYYQAKQVADSMSRILTDQVVVAEPLSLQFLRALLERFGHQGEIRFVPIGLLVKTMFPEVSSDSIQDLARQLEIPERSNAGLLRTAYFEHALLRKCRAELGVSLPDEPEPEADTAASASAPKKRRISSKTLKRWAKNVWSVSPWVVVGVAFLLVLFVVIHLPRKENTEVDRNTPVINYLVLSWDETGKYGTRTRGRSDEEPVVEFRVPYGVYDVLNNNSIPVELTIATDKKPAAKVSPSSSPSSEPSPESSSDPSPDSATADANAEVVAAELSSSAAVGPADVDEEEEDISEVPEEKESDVTGHDNGDSSRVVYAYVKGTEVRFRKSPSLEGAIIDSMQNGQQVQVLGVTGEWTHVAVQNEKGYIFSQFLTSEDPQAAAYEAKKAEEAARQALNAPAGDTADPATGAVGETVPDAGSPDAASTQSQAVPDDTAAAAQVVPDGSVAVSG